MCSPANQTNCEDIICYQCKKKLKPDNWVKCYGEYFCNMKCLTIFEDENPNKIRKGLQSSND